MGPIFRTKVSLGHAGLVLSILGLVGVAAGLPAAAWLRRGDVPTFERYVGWANILAMSFGILGVVLVIGDRIRVGRERTQAGLREAADGLAAEVLRREGIQLARLLGTDELDSRAARTMLETSAPGRRRGGRPPLMDAASLPTHVTASAGRILLTGGPGSGKRWPR
jgi:hypothetical protein